MLPIVKIAACHVSPIFLNAEKTTEKTIRLIDEAASNGAHLVAFPESYIPGFSDLGRYGCAGRQFRSLRSVC